MIPVRVQKIKISMRTSHPLLRMIFGVTNHILLSRGINDSLISNSGIPLDVRIRLNRDPAAFFGLPPGIAPAGTFLF
jgi:hypothetical protein